MSSTDQHPPHQPGLVSGHVEYIKGAVESTVGKATGSQAWATSGSQDKAHAVSAMRTAAEKRDPSQSGYGRAEEVAGRWTGCEGMREEGAASKRMD